jgi:GT2 family glycosyltransferase
MQARVTAILVARNGAAYLDRTLAALARQVRRPDSLVVVDAGSTDDSAARLTAANPTQFVTARGRGAFGDGVSQGLRAAGAAESDDDWLWLLAHDNAPEPRALAELLGAVEIAPSVAVAGPKLMRWDKPDTISSYGASITRFGASMDLVFDELDQAQHDRQSDLLAVAAGGMLVRRRVWEQVGGFDPALPHVDAALDFCIRVRLAGHRIVGVPGARVASIGAPDLFGRTGVTSSARSRHTRLAQLHRRLAYAPAAAVPVHWLSLVPLAIGRSVAQLLGKNPGAVAGEFSAAVSAAFDTNVAPARSRIRSTRKLGWGAIAPLRMPDREARDLRANRREVRAFAENGEPQRQRAAFLSGGGAWTVITLAAVGIIAFGPFLGANSLVGGGLAPLSSSLGDLWSNVGVGWRETGGGFLGAADPFAWVLAVLGTLTFWNPSFSIVLLYLAALPLAGLGAWWATTRIAQRSWAPAVAGVLWAVAPPFLASLSSGHVGAVIAHILLPWFVLALLNSTRTWSSGAASGLLMAAIGASAPVLVPVLLVAWLAWLVTHARRAHRIVAIPGLTIVLFAPLVVQQVIAGNPLGLLADPGVVSATPALSGWQLAFASPLGGFNGWEAIVAGIGLPDVAAPIAVAALLAPLAALAILALFLPGSRRAVPALAFALLGFITAIVSAHIAVVFDGSVPVTIWAGSGLSVFWLGIVGATAIALEAIGRFVVAPALVALLTIVALSAPLLLSTLQGTGSVVAGTGRMLPALATANAANDRDLGTLELIAQADGGIGVELQRGVGTTLDSRSTIAESTMTVRESQERLAMLAGNLASRSGFDSQSELEALDIGFIVAPAASDGAAGATRTRIGESLDANPLFTAIGSTDFGFLWQYDGLETSVPERESAGALGVSILLVQSILLGAAFLLAVPTPGRRRNPTSIVDDDDDLAADLEADFTEGDDD